MYHFIIAIVVKSMVLCRVFLIPIFPLGLFHAAISLSGSFNITMSLAAAQNQNEEWLRASSCYSASASVSASASASDVVACLRSIPAEVS